MRSTLQQKFAAIQEAYPGTLWQQHHNNHNHSQRHHSQHHQHSRPQGKEVPSVALCQQALAQHMPELLALWQHLCELNNADDQQAAELSQYLPAPHITSGSQSAWQRYSPVLVRNFDGCINQGVITLLNSCWHQTQVLAICDAHWGAADGINQHGLAVSQVHGGTDTVAEGFGIALIVRYLLEFCRTTEEAITALCRIPARMDYNLTLLDKHHHCATVELQPGGGARALDQPFAINHQGDFNLHNYAQRSLAFERQQTISDQIASNRSSVDSLIQAFAYAPLFSREYNNGQGTLYTAIYHPLTTSLELRWQNHPRLRFTLSHFVEQDWLVGY